MPEIWGKGGAARVTSIGETTGTERPFRRRVFYVPGFDPFHPRRYRELYRKEAAVQARLSGYEIALSPKRSEGPYGWHVEAEIEGRRCESDVEVMIWDDIVRASMPKSVLASYWQLFRAAKTYFGTGTIFSLMRLRKGPIIAAFYPVAIVIGQTLLAILLGWIGFRLVSHFSHWALGIPVAVALAFALLHWFRIKDGKIFAWYLILDYAFTAQEGGAYPAALEARLSEFRARIREALAEEGLDEVLVVGHSSGAHLGATLLADLQREGLPAPRPVLSFLTLGHAVPMQSFLPKAQRLRRDLRDLSVQEDIPWIDVTAPGDGCAFALCDPVSVSGVAVEGKRWPLVLSCAFTQTLSPARWKALRWRWFRLHFQYLCAFDNLKGEIGDYDYFKITAGPLTLWQRLGHRRASGSRIESVATFYRSVE